MRQVTKIMFPVLTIAVFLAMLMVSQGISIAGDLEPGGPPGSIMKTLDRIPPTWSQKLQCDESACPRFEIVLDGAGVLDKETGLVWEKSPDTNIGDWDIAIYCYVKDVGSRKGWRLPTVEELASLVDPTRNNPSLPGGHPFVNVQSAFYWSATTWAVATAGAWGVFMDDGSVSIYDKTDRHYVWCVRGGHGYDAY